MKKALLLLALSFLAISCQQKESGEASTACLTKRPMQRFRMNLHSEPSSLDPRLVRDIPSITTSKMFFDGLVRMDLDGTPRPSLAEKIEVSDDGLTYTFTLRETRWSNGMLVSAEDFEYAWKSVLDSSFPGEFAHYLFAIKNAERAKRGAVSLDVVGVRALSPKKLEVVLTDPNPFFKQLVASPIFFPICKAVAEDDPDWAQRQGEDFVCNGPFRLVRWEHASELQAEKNCDYWDFDKVKLDEIVLTMIEDEHTELNMYENGELDWAGSPNSSIPPEALPTLKEREEELFILPIAGTYVYKFNTKEAPFDSVKMRKAFSMAINRKSLIDNILQANQQVASALLPPCMRLEESAETPMVAFEDQCEKARALFEEALEENEWTRETMPSVTMIFSRSEKHQKTAQAIQQRWNETFGIKVALQSYEWNTFVDRLSKHQYQVGGRGWVSDVPDPQNLLAIYKVTNDAPTGGNNDTGWEHPLFAKLLEQAAQTQNLEEREALLVEAEKILMDEMPIAPLYHSTACYLKKPYVKDVYISMLCDLDFKHASIQKR